MVTKAKFEAAIAWIAFQEKEMFKKVEDKNANLNRKVPELEAKLNSSPTAQASNWSKFLSTSGKKSNKQRNVFRVQNEPVNSCPDYPFLTKQTRRNLKISKQKT